jgi:ribosome-associated toxin RatA of RatAB toxin-antitoxin module
VGSNHHLVVAHLRIKIMGVRKRFENRNKRFDVSKISNTEVKNEIKTELINKFEVLENLRMNKHL